MKATTKGTKKTKPAKSAAAKKPAGKEAVSEKPAVNQKERADNKVDAEAKAPVQTASAKNKSGLWLVMGLLGLVVVVGGPLVWPQIAPVLKPYLSQVQLSDTNKPQPQKLTDNETQIKKTDQERNQVRNQIKNLTMQIDTLQKEISAVRDLAKQAANKQPAMAPENPALKQSVDELMQRMTQLENGLSNNNSDVMAGLRTVQQKQLDNQAAEAGRVDVQGRLANDVLAIKARLADLENNKNAASTVGNNNAALVLTIQQLRNALNSGKPFEENLQTVRALAQDAVKITQPLTTLSAVADKGVPTINMIRDGFDVMVTAVLKTKGARSDDDLIDKALLKIRSIVTIRRTDDSGDDVERVLNQAENRLQVNDLAGVIQAMEQLSAKSSTAMAASKKWLDDVRMRYSADRALSELYDYSISRLTITKSGEQG